MMQYASKRAKSLPVVLTFHKGLESVFRNELAPILVNQLAGAIRLPEVEGVALVELLVMGAYGATFLKVSSDLLRHNSISVPRVYVPIDDGLDC